MTTRLRRPSKPPPPPPPQNGLTKRLQGVEDGIGVAEPGGKSKPTSLDRQTVPVLGRYRRPGAHVGCLHLTQPSIGHEVYAMSWELSAEYTDRNGTNKARESSFCVFSLKRGCLFLFFSLSLPVSSRIVFSSYPHTYKRGGLQTSLF